MNLRAARACAALGALGIAYTVTADPPRAALAAVGSLVQPATTPTPNPVAGAPATAARVAASFTVRKPRLDVLVGQPASVAGVLRPRRSGVTVELQLKTRRHWRTVARSRTGGRGRFRLRYTPRSLGGQRARVRFGGDAAAKQATRRLRPLNAYRLAGASWYGPGMYGSGLACGGSLTPQTRGVANKTLPCGTLVTLRNGNRTVRVPVIDRGPYVAGRDFDLTTATRAALRFADTGQVWTTR